MCLGALIRVIEEKGVYFTMLLKNQKAATNILIYLLKEWAKYQKKQVYKNSL